MAITASLVTSKSNIKYLSNFSGTNGFLVLAGKKKYLFTDSRYLLEAERTLFPPFTIIEINKGFPRAIKSFVKERKIKKLEIEGTYMSVAFWKKLKRTLKGIRLADIGSFNKKRIQKTAEETSKIEKSQYITDKIFLNLKKNLKIGQSEKAIARKIELLAIEMGADRVSFPPIVAIAENSASPHHHPTDKKLKKGDMILIDMGVVFKDYCSDMTRVIFTNKPTGEQKYVYQSVLDAQLNAIRNLKAGVTGKYIDGIARNFLKKRGFHKHFGHALGHGIGLEVHELPNLSKKYLQKIPDKTVVTVEPGVYLPGKFGVRIEDMVKITGKKAVSITKSPKTIQETIVLLK